MSRMLTLRWLLGWCALHAALGCTPGECLRHSDCPREWRCRRSLCRFVGTFAAADASVPELPADANAGAGGTGSQPSANAGRGGMDSMAAGAGNAGEPMREDLDASVNLNVDISTDASADAGTPP